MLIVCNKRAFARKDGRSARQALPEIKNKNNLTGLFRVFKCSKFAYF